MDDLKKFESEMLKIIDKYSYSKFDIDIDSIFKDGLKEYRKYVSKCDDINRVNNIYYSTLIYWFCCYLDKDNYKLFIKKAKEYELYKFFYGKTTQRLFKYVPDLYLKYLFIKDKKVAFFTTKYRLFKTNKGQYYFRTYKSEGLKFLLKRKLFLDYAEIVITTKCSLRCKNCANLINLYDKPYDVKSDLIEESIKKLFKAVDKIDSEYMLHYELMDQTEDLKEKLGL